MSFNIRHKAGQSSSGVVTLGSAPVAGTVITGSTLTMSLASPGSVSALLTAVIATGSLTFTPKWQASEDGTNWYDLSLPALPAVTASGSRYVPLPYGSWRYVRAAITTAGATAGASDSYLISYVYNSPDFV